MCTASWEAEQAPTAEFFCVRCGVECELSDFEPFCSQHCKDNYDGPADGEAWSGGIAANH